ncbi:MAG: bifunctional folylpolyglutamate synthase/dihydrofolate synthase [Ruminococcaceae bacterium]|nr:bifunctional folylpolyglutamate synthase/dihydrofolate synthase [Oscillospiraceae bacterium]
MMNYKETLKYIHSLGNFSLPATLDRIKAVMLALDNPQRNFKAVHIAGTNGKGSTAAMLASVFKTEGYKTALFTSPFIIDFRERIQINGEFISENDLVRLSERVINTNIKLTEFEFITAVAFLYFSEQKCQVAVIETGLGGRLDATNVLDNKAVSVITKIGLDHTAILGDTIEKIANEKCGIIGESPTVTVANQDGAALEVIKRSANKLTLPDKSKLEVLKSDFSGNEFFYKGVKYKTRLGGVYQIENALVAIETVFESGIYVSYENLLKGIENASFPARLEGFLDGRIVLDGAHNPDGAAALAQEIKTSKKPIVAIIGMMQDKDIDEVLKLTLPNFDSVITVKAAEMPRAIDAKLLRKKAQKYSKNVICASDYKEALKLALAIDDCLIFIFGSLYLASNIRPLLLELK